MSWLALQLWIELLIAAGIGGVIGWAIHMRYGPKAAAAAAATPVPVSNPEEPLRIAALESRLKTERAELAELRRKLAAMEAASPPPPEGEEDGLAWRNKFLESRVRFLEGKVADLELAAAQPHLEDDNTESTRLRWRNRYLDGRVKYLEEELEKTGGLVPAEVASSPVAAPPTAESITVPVGQAPEKLSAARGGRPDDLKLIAGVGPKIEKLLNGLGVWHYDQIAAWTQTEIDWVNNAMSFRGRIERDRWVQQAQMLFENRGQQPLP